jgi:DNA-binding response OmpR family regulator
MGNTNSKSSDNKKKVDLSRSEVRRPGSVLVVEDDPDIRAIIVHTLERDGHQIHEAGDGMEAIEVLESKDIDLLVTDLMMPRMDGVSLIEWCRENRGNSFLPILILTALAEPQEKVKGLEAGADDYLAKPFNHRELQARVRALLRIHELTKSLEQRSIELEKANEDLKKTQDELVAKERQLAVAQLIGTTAHALGQPITAILLNCRLVEKTEGVASSKHLTAIKEECQSIQQLLEQLKEIDANVVRGYTDNCSILDIDSNVKK